MSRKIKMSELRELMYADVLDLIEGEDFEAILEAVEAGRELFAFYEQEEGDRPWFNRPRAAFARIDFDETP